MSPSNAVCAIRFPLLCALGLFGGEVLADPPIQPPTTQAAVPADTSVPVTWEQSLRSVGSFWSQRGCDRVTVYESLANSGTQPERWVFYFEPNLTARFGANGIPETETTRFGDRVRVRIPLVLFDTTDLQHAYERVRTRFPDQADRIRPDCIEPLRVQQVRLKLADLEAFQGARLLTPILRLAGREREVNLFIEFANEQEARAFTEGLISTNLEFSLMYAAKVVQRSEAVVRVRDLESTSVWRLLDGRGTQGHLVYRDELAKTVRRSVEELSIWSMMDRPDDLSESLLNAILSRFTTQVDAKSLSPEETKSLESSAALEPDVIYRQKKERADSASSEGRQSVNANANTGGGYGPYNGKGDFSRSTAEESKQESDHRRKEEFEGKKTSPKEMEIRRVMDGNARLDDALVTTRVFPRDAMRVVDGNVTFVKPSSSTPSEPVAFVTKKYRHVRTTPCIYFKCLREDQRKEDGVVGRPENVTERFPWKPGDKIASAPDVKPVAYIERSSELAAGSPSAEVNADGHIMVTVNTNGSHQHNGFVMGFEISIDVLNDDPEGQEGK
jgi:hypothetical protein